MANNLWAIFSPIISSLIPTPLLLTQTDQAHKLPVLSAGRKVFHVPDSCNKNMPVCLVTVCARGGGSEVGARAGCLCVGTGAQDIVQNWGGLRAWDCMGGSKVVQACVQRLHVCAASVCTSYERQCVLCMHVL